MENKEVERFFDKISSKEPLYISENDFRIIERMVDEGLIKPNDGGYSITEYGKVIEVAGYDVHKKKKTEEKILSNSVVPESIIILLSWLVAIISVLTCLFYLNT